MNFFQTGLAKDIACEETLKSICASPKVAFALTSALSNWKEAFPGAMAQDIVRGKKQYM